MADQEGRFEGVEEVAERLLVDPQTVRRWIKSGKLKAYKPGREYRILSHDLDAFLESRSSPKAQASPEQASPERRGAELDVVLSEKLQQQLDTQLRVLKEKKSDARSDEDLHEAAKDFHHWWLFTFDWLSTILRVFPEGAGPQLEEAVNRASQAHGDEVAQGAPNPRNTPDMAEVLQQWAVHQDADA